MKAQYTVSQVAKVQSHRDSSNQSSFANAHAMDPASLRVGSESEEWQFVKHPTLACLFAHTVPIQAVEASGWIPANFRRQFRMLGMQGEVRLVRNIFGLTVLDVLQDAAERDPDCREV